MQCLSVHSQQPHAWAAHTGASSHPDALTSGCRVTLVSQELRKVLRRLHWARPLPLLPLVQWGSGGVGAAHSLHWGSLSPSKSLKLLLSEEKKKEAAGRALGCGASPAASRPKGRGGAGRAGPLPAGRMRAGPGVARGACSQGLCPLARLCPGAAVASWRPRGVRPGALPRRGAARWLSAWARAGAGAGAGAAAGREVGRAALSTAHGEGSSRQRGRARGLFER